nr:hypothetical protein [Sphingopyxis terrae]
MDDHEIEGLVRAFCGVDHLLEYGPVLIQCRSARFGKYPDDLDALPFTPDTALDDLIGN